jgi:hypothetical protein
VRLGVHEYLLKPVSSGALRGRIRARQSAHRDAAYGPGRAAHHHKPGAGGYNQRAEQVVVRPPPQIVG